MALNVLITKTGTVSEDFCFTNWNALLQVLVNNLAGELAGSGTLPIYGSDTPDSSNRDRPWIRTNTDGSPDDTYVFWNGLWVRKHPVPAGSSLRQMWVGTEGALEVFDGGTTDDVTDVSGPFWEIDSDFAAKFPVGPGTYESGATVAVNGDGGTEQTTLLPDNLPAHAHIVAIEQPGSSGITVEAESTGYFAVNGPGELAFNVGGSSTNSGNTRAAGGTDDGTTPHSNLPPYRGVYFIKRTARVYYTV